MKAFDAIETSEADLSFLKTQLGALIKRHGASALVEAELFGALAGCYSEPGRRKRKAEGAKG